ncbi:MAG: T9SS type A sorting domain-containing protein [Paludibacteraceae bacterium]|nr:T9SS type A sorting domain-containing protein [Paludibacteraceae bacterium]
MKTRFGMLLIALLLYVTAIGQAHITIDNPSTWSGEALRPYIGQTVIFDVPVVVCSNANGNYIVSPWRRFHPESHGFPGSEDHQSTVRVNSSCMFSISGINNYHRCGEKIIGLKARVISTSSLTFQGGQWSGNTRADLEAGIPDLGDYRLLVCGFNVENYFMTWGSMGAYSYAEHQAQRAKVHKALKKINADIYGLVELQKGDEALKEIVNDLNKALPKRHYKYFSGDASGTFQKVDFVYDENTVEPINTPVGTDEEVADRKKMICFREKETGEKFIYSINHFKSMYTGDEYRRVNEAKAVVKLYNTYKQNKNIHEKDVLFMGDMNCYAFTEPIKVFTESGMIDLHRAFHGDSSYSYMFGGMASYIDHAISNGTMYRQVTGMSGFHINPDEDDRYNYQRSSDETMFRCSDHDPVLVGLKLDSTLVYDPTPQVNTCEILSGESKKMIIQNAYTDGQQSFYAIYTINGWLVEQKKITSPLYEVELPNPAGVYIVTVYYDGQIYQRKMIVR